MTYQTKPVKVSKPEKAPIFDLVFRLHFQQYVQAHWCHLMSPGEQAVINFIMSRTVYWGKAWELISYKHFTEGCAGHFGGTGMARNSVRKHVDSLCAGGFIRRRRHGDTFQYQLNYQDAGLENDPRFSRQDHKDAHAGAMAEMRSEKAHRVRELHRKYVETNCVDYIREAQKITKIRGSKFDPIRSNISLSPSVTGPHPTDASERASTPEDIAEKGATGMGLLKGRRTPKETRAEDQPTEVAQARVRTRKIKITGNVGSTPMDPTVVHKTREAMKQRSVSLQTQQATAQTDNLQKTRDTTATGALVREALSNSEAKRHHRLRKGKVTILKVKEAWSDAHNKRYGFLPKQSWQYRHIGRLKHILANSADMPDPDISWIDVVEWYARDYGAAVQLAIPFMLQDKQKRHEILSSLPQITLLLPFMEYFLDAYHRAHYGAGIPKHIADAAAQADAEHDKYMQRAQEQSRVGEYNLPVSMLTDDEVLTHAQNVQDQNPEIAEVMRRRNVFSSLGDALSGEGYNPRQVREAQQEAYEGMHEQDSLPMQEERAKQAEDAMVQLMRDTYDPDMSREEAIAMAKDMNEGQ